MEGLRSIEMKLQSRLGMEGAMDSAKIGAACGRPARPGQNSFRDGTTKEEKEPKSKLHSDILAMALGSPALSLIGAIGAALTLGARRGGVLIPLLILPLYVPVLIFGVASTDVALIGFSARQALLFLGAILLVMTLVAPLASAAALRQALE